MKKISLFGFDISISKSNPNVEKKDYNLVFKEKEIISLTTYENKFREFFIKQYLDRDLKFIKSNYKCEIWREYEDNFYEFDIYHNKYDYYSVLSIRINGLDIMNDPISYYGIPSYYEIDFILNGKGSMVFKDKEKHKELIDKYILYIYNQLNF